MPNLDLNQSTIELVSTLRKAPANGAPSSEDYNDSAREVLADLAALAAEYNNIILPLVNALPAGALLPITAPVGIEGRTIWSDTSDQTSLFYDSSSGVPLSIADSIRLLNGMLTTFGQQLTDMSISVATLQARLASTSQNDVSLALQGLSNSLNQIAVTQAGQRDQITTIQATDASQQSQINSLLASIGAPGQHKLVATPSISPTAIQAVTILWTTPFSNDNYVVTCSVQDDSGNLEVVNFSYIPGGLGVDVRVRNSDFTAAHAGIVHASASAAD